MIKTSTRILAKTSGSRGTAAWGYPAILLLVLLAFIVLALQSYRAIDRELTDAALARRASVSYLAAATLSEKFDRLTDIGVSLATRVRFRDLISEGKWGEASEILSGVRADFPFIDRLTLNDTEGTLRAGVPEDPGVRGKSFAHRDWYQGVRRNWEPYVSGVYTRAAAPQANVFAVAVPIKSKHREVVGILVLQVRLDTFFDWTRGIEIGPGGALYVVDQRGMVAFHPKLPPQGKFVDFSAVAFVRQVSQGKRGIEIASDPLDNEENLVAYAPITKYGWGVIAQQPTRTAFAEKNHQLRRVLIAYALILSFGISVAYLTSRMVIQRRVAAEHQRVKAELECRVAERTAQLEVTNKELESFSYSVSHDLRSPLRAIDGFSRMLEEDYRDKLDDEGRRQIKVIRDSSRKMARLIDDLLAFSRLGRTPVAAAEVDMGALAQSVFDELRTVSRDTPARFDLKPMPPARCDPALLQQAWVNLLSNALKFAGRRENPVIEAGGHVDGTERIYYVKDNGAGFDMRYYDKLFGVFQRLHRADEFPGTGVGLAIVQRVVARHGGRVWAEGKVNEGATFYFSLPSGEAS